ncbi:MAG: putative motility protein [Oscillospiraceae bacterium]
MDTSIAAMSMQNNIASLQSSISMIMVDKAMNQDAASVDALISSLPTPPPPAGIGEVGHLMDIMA